MDSFLLMLIASIFISVQANDKPQIEIYEIRKPRDNSNRLDFQYYDPNEDQLEYRYRLNNRENNKMRESNVDLVTNNLIDKLRRIVNSQSYHSKRDDYISSYKDLKADSDNIFEDGKTPVIVIADDKILYHLIPEKSRSLKNKLQSVLRSINFENEVEDRTAAPRTKIAYDYDYD